MGSILPSSFSWGFSPKIENTQAGTEDRKVAKHGPSSSVISPEILSSLQMSLASPQHHSKAKRKHQDDEQESQLSSSPRRIKKIDKFRISKKDFSNKKTRSVQHITGQPLPTHRIVEVLDKKNLQTLLNNLINIHPEITQDIYRCAPKPTVAASIEVLNQQIASITNALPYNVDSSSEYSYLRVKPLIEGFLNALSDYTLHFLPPVEIQPSNSLDFLDQATILLHQLPTFSKASNNYFKDMAYEQLSHTWCICLKEFIKNSNSSSMNSGLLLLTNSNWDAKLKKHNELANGKLVSVVEFFKDEVSWLYEEFNELESTNRISNLKNFSPNNSPLHGFKKNLLDG